MSDPDQLRAEFHAALAAARTPDDLQNVRDRFFGEERFYQASPPWDDAREPESGLDGLFALAADP